MTGASASFTGNFSALGFADDRSRHGIHVNLGAGKRDRSISRCGRADVGAKGEGTTTVLG